MMSCFLLGFMLLAQEAEPYVLILSNQKQMKVKQAPICDGRVCKVTLLNGDLTTLPARSIDHDRTKAYNLELAEQRRIEAESREEAARAEAEAVAKEEQKTITLSKWERLPSYDRANNSVSGTVAAGTKAVEGIVGEPRERTFTSTDPVFLTRERITRFQDHYEIECELGTNLPNGAQNIRLQLKVNYADGLPDEVMKRTSVLTPAKPETIKFVINRSDEILQTGYIIDYETKE